VGGERDPGDEAVDHVVADIFGIEPIFRAA
jgi:hypothetical protein